MQFVTEQMASATPFTDEQIQDLQGPSIHRSPINFETVVSPSLFSNSYSNKQTSSGFSAKLNNCDSKDFYMSAAIRKGLA